jgi:hypothetical protein
MGRLRRWPQIALAVPVAAELIAVQRIQETRTSHELPAPFTLVLLIGVVVVNDHPVPMVSLRRSDPEPHGDADECQRGRHRVAQMVCSVTTYRGASMVAAMRPPVG